MSTMRRKKKKKEREKERERERKKERDRKFVPLVASSSVQEYVCLADTLSYANKEKNATRVAAKRKYKSLIFWACMYLVSRHSLQVL
jgi:hypothetical protein